MKLARALRSVESDWHADARVLNYSYLYFCNSQNNEYLLWVLMVILFPYDQKKCKECNQLCQVFWSIIGPTVTKKKTNFTQN